MKTESSAVITRTGSVDNRLLVGLGGSGKEPVHRSRHAQASVPSRVTSRVASLSEAPLRMLKETVTEGKSRCDSLAAEWYWFALHDGGNSGDTILSPAPMRTCWE